MAAKKAKGAIVAVDLFAGAGGTSTGLVQACKASGRSVSLTAVNHWELAVSTHTANHPDAQHFCASVTSVKPKDVAPRGKIDLLWASPECIFHSRARGGKPVNDQRRSTAWCVFDWAKAAKPEVIWVENVPEFKDWGPLGRDNKPLKRKKGEIFNKWVSDIASLGYDADYKVLRAADYGDPTTRDRLFVRFIRKGKKADWPAQTHAEKPGRGQQPWKGADKHVIDWSLKGGSIFNRPRALSRNTMRRIAAGLRRFGLGDFVVAWDNHGRGGDSVRSTAAPLSTVVTKARHGVVSAELTPFVLPNEGVHKGNAARSVKRPLPTVTASRGCGALVQPFLVQTAHSGADASRVRSVSRPLATVAGNRGDAALIEPFIIEMRGTQKRHLDRPPRSVKEPMNTVTAGGVHAALVQPQISPFIIPQHSGGAPRSVRKPAPTVCTTSRGVALVEPFIVKYYATGGAVSTKNPLDTVTTKARFGLASPSLSANAKSIPYAVPTIDINGTLYALDVMFRMLQPAELARAQGFPKDYVFRGNKTQRVAQIGNAVPCGLARALVASTMHLL